MSYQTSVSITHSAVNLEGVEGFAKLVYENVPHLEGNHTAERHEVETTEGPKGEYYVGSICLLVETEDLNNCLVTLDSVDSGFISDSEEVMALQFGDMRVEVSALEDELGTISVLNEYLHNKVQEQSQAIFNLETQIQGLIDVCSTNTTTLLSMQNTIQGLQTIILAMDIPGLRKLVCDVAAEVDPDLLDDHEVVSIH
jgi:hypothetical protein